jgi:endo-1,4-beta-mannosidase
MRAALATIAVLLVLPATAWSAAPALKGVGITNITPHTPIAAIDAELDRVDEVGANTLRADINWAALEPEQGRLDAAYVERIDRLVSGAKRRGIKPLLVVLRSPCWASAAPGAPEACPKSVITYPPRDPDDYGSIARRLAERYEGRLAGFEVWNEPDHEQEFYFAGPDKPQRYAALVRSANREIKRVAPGLPVLAGSLVGANGAFLEALYDAGMKGHYDGLAIHYYDLTLASIRAIRAVQRKHGDRAPLWLTEFGWTSCWPERRSEANHACVTSRQQARNYDDIFRALDGTRYLRAAVVYNLRDTRNAHFGILGTDGARKPAFSALRRVFSSAPGRPRAVTAAVRNGRLTGRAPVGDVVLAQGFRGTQFVYNAVLAPDRFGRFSLRLPSELRGTRLVVGQEWTGRQTTVYP